MNNTPYNRFKITYLFLYLFFIIQPFFFMHKYFKITEDKWGFFMMASIAFLVLSLCSIIIKEPLTQLIDLFANWGFCEWAMLCLILANIISLLVSEYPMKSFTGSAGRNHGFSNFLIYFLTFIIIRRSLTKSASRFIINALTIVGAFVSLFAILQYLEFNPLGMYTGVSRRSKLSLISPIGNMNTFSLYLNIVVPLAIYLFVIANNTNTMLIMGICVALGAMGGITSTSDSFYIGIILTPILLHCFGCLKAKEAYRLPLAYLIGSLSDFLLITIANSMAKGGKDIRPGAGVTKYLNHHTHVLLLVALISGSLCLLYYYLGKNAEKNKLLISEKLSNKLIIILAAGFFVAILVWILSYPYNNEMGSYRGFIWNLSIRDFKESTLLTKLFGHGQETILMVFDSNYYKEMVEVTGVRYDNVHCEVLEYLLTTGIVGLLAYLAFVGGVFTKLTRSIHANKDAMLFLLPAICYFAQSFVNIAQSAVTPIFFFLLFMGVNSLQEDMPPSA